MRFGSLPLDAALGAVLAHTVMPGGRRIGKGQCLTPEDVAALRAAGVATVTVAALEPDDVGEEAAALALALALLPDHSGLVRT